jgi:hypothetical protein
MMKNMILLTLMFGLVSAGLWADEAEENLLLPAGVTVGYRYQLDEDSTDPVTPYWFLGSYIGLIFPYTTSLTDFSPEMTYRFGLGVSGTTVSPEGFRVSFHVPNIYIGDPKGLAAIFSLIAGFGIEGSQGINEMHFGAGAGIAFSSFELRLDNLIDLRGSIAQRMSLGYIFDL